MKRQPARVALAAIAARAVSRETLRADGFHSLYHSSDLFSHGYRVRHWIDRHGREILEYLPRETVTMTSDLPRLTVSTYEDQCAVHRALGLNLVPPGAPWSDYGQAGLFDQQSAVTEEIECPPTPATDAP